MKRKIRTQGRRVPSIAAAMSILLMSSYPILAMNILRLLFFKIEKKSRFFNDYKSPKPLLVAKIVAFSQLQSKFVSG